MPNTPPPPLRAPVGIELDYVTCRGCRREVVFRDVGNDLVGRHEQLVCTACGHRGADVLRVWSQGPAPAGVRGWNGMAGEGRK